MIVFSIFGVLLLSSCDLTSSLQSNEKLLVKNKIIFKEKIKNQAKYTDQIQLLTFQKPNNKLFYIFPLKLAIYNLANNTNKRERKFGWWVKNKLGEPPVVFKESLVLGSTKSMKNYLFNLGYLYNNVEPELIIKNRKVTVKYFITPNTIYKINKVIFPEPTNEITKIINEVAKKSLLKSEDNLNINVLDEERTRITTSLRNRGYYFFNKEYLSFEIDSNDKKNRVDLKMSVNPPKDPKGQEKFNINDVYVYTDYQVEKKTETQKIDTVLYEDYHFIWEKKSFLPKSLLLGIYFKKGDVYSMRNHIKSQQRIVSFGAFKFVNIEYKLSEVDSNALDTYVLLTPSKKQAISGDFELSHSFEGLSGSALSFTYRNMNLTKRSDLLQFKASAGVELNLFNKNATSLLNAADFTLDLSYFVNRFIVPFPLKKVSKNSNVKTKFSLTYNYEERIKRFTKHSTTFTAGYEWNKSSKMKHFYNPISVSLLLIPSKDSIFQSQLDRVPSLKYSFEENIIFGSTYTFLYTNKKSEDDRSYFKFQGDVYLAGNIIHSIMLLAKRKSADTIPYEILKKDYAQFARFEGSIVQHNKIGNHSEFVSRFNAGIVIPYGNSRVAPYFQQFFVGGANSMRAFRLRALGPGSFQGDNTTSTFLYQSGDIKLELNAEYRFDIYKWLKWALFIDAGNVWGLRKDPDKPGGVMSGDFYKSIAVGAGMGLRLDFEYFVIRTDLAMPILDPRKIPSERWRLSKNAIGINHWSKDNLIFNLAIGYPF